MSKRMTTLGTAAEHTASSFFTWWFDGLSDCVDIWSRPRGDWTKLLFVTSVGIAVYVRDGDEVRHVRDVTSAELAALTVEPGHPTRRRKDRSEVVILRFSDSQVLQHTLRIPRGARDVVDPIVRNQLERIVPWPLPDLCYGYEIIDQDAETDCVQIFATSRKRLEEARAQAEALGVTPDYIDFATNIEALVGIRLADAVQVSRHSSIRVIQSALAVLMVAALAATAVGLWRMVALRSELAELQSTLSGVRTKVVEADRLHRENSKLIGQRARLVDRRATQPAMVLVIEALSKALPDHAHLEKLEIRQREAILTGVSTDAASLVTQIENSPYFSNVGFTAPTTRNNGARTETFVISAGLEDGLRNETPQ